MSDWANTWQTRSSNSLPRSIACRARARAFSRYPSSQSAQEDQLRLAIPGSDPYILLSSRCCWKSYKPDLLPGWIIRLLVLAEEFHESCAMLIAPGPSLPPCCQEERMPHFRINQRCIPHEEVCGFHRNGVRHTPFWCAPYSVLLCGLGRFMQCAL